ncbi:MAG: peptidylprolyl isomerase [Gammaproteobacteria bacterium]|jgi:peptidyl-prolyl cis-trans isomerase C|nr:peptidylprolyl isomerase [Gammaproteobacteria bacterium]|tara:strand:- start:2956 stop:3747 length:792 start_codon:yes stop_codon:yes gene_type:complete
MMKYALAFFLVITLSACNHEEAENKVADEQIAARVNALIISHADVTNYKTAKNMPQATDEQVIEELIATELLRQAAEDSKLLERDDIRYQLRLQKSEFMARAFMRNKFSQMTFTEDELRAEYELGGDDKSKVEYKARHILVKTPDEARAIIDALRAGGDFMSLAKERSTGPSSKNGGDLGWFQAANMVPEFSTALQSMTAGDISVNPVQTKFGWHIIKLEDIREPAKPDFENVRGQIQQSLLNKAINDYMEDLRQNADVDIRK